MSLTVLDPGPYSLLVDLGVNGYLAKSDADWVERISQLLENSALRERLGQQGRAIVEQRFALEKQAQTMAELFRKAAEAPTP